MNLKTLKEFSIFFEIQDFFSFIGLIQRIYLIYWKIAWDGWDTPVTLYDMVYLIVPSSEILLSSRSKPISQGLCAENVVTISLFALNIMVMVTTGLESTKKLLKVSDTPHCLTRKLKMFTFNL